MSSFPAPAPTPLATGSTPVAPPVAPAPLDLAAAPERSHARLAIVALVILVVLVLLALSAAGFVPLFGSVLWGAAIAIPRAGATWL